ncbi:Asp/Glu racemase [Nereida ignava]|uniref:maleate cis-trans isomerase family protein n=1 Tax=Nereida ignava TaxID=282199 RepID=UPI0030F90B9A
MMEMPYSVMPISALPPALGVIVLQADETLENEFRDSFQWVNAALYVSRIASAKSVTPETLSAMQDDITASARLLPTTMPYAAIGYGCTSASAIIGSDAIEKMVQSVCDVAHVTNPLRAAIAYAADQGVSRMALLSPYTESVNEPLRRAFATAGLSTDVFGSFNEPVESRVARINPASIIESAIKLGQDPDVDCVFISCTNLKTTSAIPMIQDQLQKPVFSSNSALSWHLKTYAKLHNFTAEAL